MAVQKYAIRLKISAKIFGLKLTMWATKHMANVVFADEKENVYILGVKTSLN